ncbi:2-oxo-hept-4-ene-1,7-dioate hydratase [Providencia stuartii]|uniref:2-oxo-hepta-3-ene-1,7-dioic acid hydratase n=1 Tax=Providencia stuartii (strain MRSN 2154) TaxID=1157951 RepID=A0A140NMI4_PROSM|nr:MULTISPECIES: 2-oxo-hepta-3-ene-1,7-dioic acid hydratase [Providencia]AFH93162.1 2-oxo-hepta-3-ene-1,7-dioic acid hydratase [Providencia stuartii MRSN 2154]MDE8746601.1 2-oxo-hepta-3-ene-1,7-dioic acid hydratase [Providencia thailandensis]MDE8765356.1 2-oxo-hepta-3-ene-1,7-dioic acid hydratase [Providencia thailandensis]MDE8777646.1 2-oxo-hepta-3-ene-1,7-dioic acid hydratase [Providencia thailandensis]MDE8781635.1 2-oxo-hepta-3-ene-1,7-dioic acid hydratase [Providencia thailandensis]
MLQKDVISQVAQRLNQAEKTREQIRQISLDHPQITIEDAYAIQREWIGLKIAEGRSLKGHKIGLTSKAMQASSQIDEPDYGALLDDMFFDDGCEIPTDRFIVPRIEVELAFVLAKPLSGPNCTLFDVYNATDYVIPALELIDARCHGIDPETKRPRKVFDTISDNAANAAVILGGRPIKPRDLDLRWISALLYRNGVIEESGVAAAVLNHPANGVAWLANKLAPHNVQLEAGQIILGGSFTRPVPARKGDVFHVDYGVMGSVSCRFV